MKGVSGALNVAVRRKPGLLAVESSFGKGRLVCVVCTLAPYLAAQVAAQRMCVPVLHHLCASPGPPVFRAIHPSTTLRRPILSLHLSMLLSIAWPLYSFSLSAKAFVTGEDLESYPDGELRVSLPPALPRPLDSHSFIITAMSAPA